MKSREVELMAKAMAPVFRDYVQKQLEPLRLRIKELEQTQTKSSGVRYCGVHQRALDYEQGSIATHRSGIWIALRDTSQTPGDGDHWQLMLKGA